MRYVTIAKFARDIGRAEDDLHDKIESGAWTLGQQYRRTVDGDLLIDTESVTKRDLRLKAPKRLAAVEMPPVQAKCGVYLLLNAESVVYVGRSTDLRTRLATHRASGREFDEARIIPCDADTSVWLEKELIRTLRPVQNMIRYQRHTRIAERALRREGLR